MKPSKIRNIITGTFAWIAIGVSCPHPAEAAPAARPNILFIAVDDLRPELGCYGRTHIKSPNIDALAARGMVFNRAYCQQAVCNPSRASLLTGLRPDSTGVHDNNTRFRVKVPDVITLPQQFKEHGYHTQALGKLFHGAFDKAYTGRKFDDLPSWSGPHWMGGPRYYFTPRGIAVAREVFARETGKTGAGLDGWPEAFVRGLATEAPDVPDNFLYDGEMTDHAVGVLREIKDRPFFLAVGFIKPHLPFIAPKKYWDLYDPAKIALAPNPFPPKGAPAVAMHNWEEMRYYHDIPKKGPLTGTQARELRHGYYACVSFVDAQIGRLLGELDRLGLRENTIVVLWGDHGWHLGEHNVWGKQTNFEDATRAPLIVCVPGKKIASHSTDALVEFVDIYPTLCELAGLPLPPHLEGASFAPLLDNPGRTWKSAAFSQFPRPNVMGYSMRTDRYRLTAWQQLRTPDQVAAIELYDHQADPGEDVNIAERPENETLVKELTAKLHQGWRAAKPAR